MKGLGVAKVRGRRIFNEDTKITKVWIDFELQSGDGGNNAKNNSGNITKNKWPISGNFEESIDEPCDTIDGGNDR